jgi:FtsX-like permease family
MSFWRRLLDGLTDRADRDVDRELRTHLDLEGKEQQEARLPSVEACHAAQRALGNLTLIKENTRAIWGWTSLAMQVISLVQRAVWSVDKYQPINDVRTMESQVAKASIGLRRASMLLLVLFSGVALLLASLGIYSVISYGVTRRTHEIGVPMALGARPAEILRTLVRQGAMLTLVGTAAGSIAASGLTHFLATLLFEVTPTDWGSL